MRYVPSILSCRSITAAALLIILIALAVRSWLRADDEFKALPGLWKTTLRASNSAPNAHPVVKWHCVYEKADPWASFADFSSELGKSCKRTYSSRTSTQLKWRYDCKDSSEEGSVVFSANDHYTGKVELSGDSGGHRIDRTITIEGKRYAACTSPAD